MTEVTTIEATETPTIGTDTAAPEVITFAAGPAGHGASRPHECEDGGAQDQPPEATPADPEAEADDEERLIREVMPLVFDAMDATDRYHGTPATQEMRRASATTIARVLLVERGVEPGHGDRLERLSGLIGRGVCSEDVEEGPGRPRKGPDQAPAEQDAHAPGPPTVAELAIAVRIGRERIAAELGKLATASPEEQGVILARVEALRATVVELESQLPDQPVFPEDAEPAPPVEVITPPSTRRQLRADPATPSLIVPALLLGVGLAAQAGAFYLLARRGQTASKGDRS